MSIKRNTTQRKLILETVNNIGIHATAEDIYEVIVRDHPNLSRATVYRNLNQLAESGEIRRVEVPGGADCFEHNTPPHYHIRCQRCKKLYDADMEYLADLQNKIRDAHGFLICGHDIMFQGICPACQQKMNNDAHAALSALK